MNGPTWELIPRSSNLIHIIHVAIPYPYETCDDSSRELYLPRYLSTPLHLPYYY